MTEEGEISSPDVDEHDEISGENVVNVLDDILGEPANDEFAAELDTKPTTPVTPEAPGLPEQSKTANKKASSEPKSNQTVKEKTGSDNKPTADETKTKPKATASKKTKIGIKAKASLSASGSGSEKPKKILKGSAKESAGSQETAIAAKEKNITNPANVKAEVKPKEVVKAKVAQKTKIGVKRKAIETPKATKSVAKGKPEGGSADGKNADVAAVTEKSNSKNVMIEKPTDEKKKIVKKIVKMPMTRKTAVKNTKPKSAAPTKEVKNEKPAQKVIPEKKAMKAEREGKEEKVASDSKATSTVNMEITTAKKRPASTKTVLVKAKKSKPDEKKLVKKAKVVSEKKQTVKTEESEDKSSVQDKTEKKEPNVREENENAITEEKSKPDDVEMKVLKYESVDDVAEPAGTVKIDDQCDNQMTVVDDVGNSSPGGSPGNSRQQSMSRSRSGSRSSYSSNKSGSDAESRDGEKQSRKRSHKSISPIVYDKEKDKDSSGSESDSSGSEGSDTPVKSKVDKVEKPNIDEYLEDARFFIMKSSNYENVSLSKAKGVWSTPYANEKRINFSLKKYRNVILIYSIKESGKFQGFARVLGEAEYGGRPVPWVLPPGLNARALGGVFKLEWLNRKELPFAKCSHLRNPYNDNKDVKICRDGQEVEPNVGRILCKLFPEDENVKLGSKRRSIREKELKRVDHESPRRHRRHSSPSSHRRKRRRRDREGRHRSRERYDGLGNMIDPRSRYAGVRKETLMHGSYSDYVREFHRSRQPAPAFPPYRGMDPYAVVYAADFMRHERPPSYSRRRR